MKMSPAKLQDVVGSKQKAEGSPAPMGDPQKPCMHFILVKGSPLSLQTGFSTRFGSWLSILCEWRPYHDRICMNQKSIVQAIWKIAAGRRSHRKLLWNPEVSFLICLSFFPTKG